MIARNLFLLGFLLLTANGVSAGTLSAGLESLLKDHDEGVALKVLVVLEQQADISDLDRSLRQAKATRPRRHGLVVEALRTTAANSQADLLADLATKSATGRVVGYVPHWLINAVVVTATPAVIRDIAARPDVARVEPDLEVSLVSPVPGEKSLPTFWNSNPGGIGIAPGVRAVGASRVWTELGIDGTGTIIGCLDSGVDGNHPALADRWRGNFFPADECWLDAAGSGDPSFPVDRNSLGHGTHVMGILTGLADGDTIGVAPGAHWIAANALSSPLSGLDNAVLASLEFMTDPDGDPTTTDDVPDVVQNSWGINEAFDGYFDCDSRWWDAIDNCEAAGVVLVWSAGNEGPFPQTLRSPADRNTNPLNCFSVGSTDAVSPFFISDFSSRGPSGCGGADVVKPEVVAPGRDIYSAQVGGGYHLLSGTSMAGPHVAGVVALMRQANPDLDVVSIKEILLSTALDRGEPGQDNTYGHGFIDAFAAVTAVMDEAGTVVGTVTDHTTGLPLADATIANLGGFNSVQTNADGYYSLTMLSGPVDFLVSRYGYFDGGFSATISPGQVVTHDVALSALPTATVSGQVFDPTGQPLSAATVEPLGVPVDAVVTGADGYYELVLPKGQGLIYQLRGFTPGLGYQVQVLELPGDQTLDFHLPELFVEDFESGDFLTFPWSGAGTTSWIIDQDTKFEGAFSARSGPVGNNQISILSLEFYVSADSYLQFWTKVSSEFMYDGLLFWLDDDLVTFWTGEHDWSQYRLLVPRGHHEFRWEYVKDEAFSEGQDAAWLDFVEFPTSGVEQLPRISLDVVSVAASVSAGDTTSVPFNVSNTGDWILDFSLTVGDPLQGSPQDDRVFLLDPPGPVAAVFPSTGEVAPGSSVPVTVTFDATHLDPGLQVAVMTVASTDPVDPAILVPLILTVTEVSATPEDFLPKVVTFTGAVPNPFNPSTRLHFSLPEAAEVDLSLFDVSGRRIRSLVSGPQSAGRQVVPWYGRDDAGRNVASGTYYARLTVDGLTSVKSVTLVR